jgi:hypothetical protein
MDSRLDCDLSISSIGHSDLLAKWRHCSVLQEEDHRKESPYPIQDVLKEPKMRDLEIPAQYYGDCSGGCLVHARRALGTQGFSSDSLSALPPSGTLVLTEYCRTSANTRKNA